MTMNKRITPEYGAHLDFSIRKLAAQVETVSSSVAASARPYKVYTAVLAQTGTSTPTATVLENSLGGAVTINRSGVGSFTADTTGGGLFTVGKTAVFITSGVGGILAVAYPTSGSSISFFTTDTFTNATTDTATRATLEIRVYP